MADREESTSLRDDLNHAVESLKEHETVGEDAKRISEARSRDDKGRFAEPKEPKEPKGDKQRETLKLKGGDANPEPSRKPDASRPVEQGVPQGAQAIKPPEGWSAPMKAKFAELSPEVQAEIDRREKDMHKRLTAQDGERTLGKSIREAAAPYQAILAAEQADPVAAFKQFLNYAYIMRTGTPEQKQMALLNVARQYNIQLASPSQGQLQGHDPRYETLQQEIDRIKQERLQESTQRQQQEQQLLTGEIEAFQAAPGHEHFETVRTAMGHLLEAGLAENLQEAYDKSVRMQGLVPSAPSADEQRRREQEKVDAAKRASGSVTGAPGGAKPNGSVPSSDRSLREEIRANLRAASGRV